MRPPPLDKRLARGGLAAVALLALLIWAVSRSGDPAPHREAASPPPSSLSALVAPKPLGAGTPVQQLRAVLHEPNAKLREYLFYGFVQTLSPEDFPYVYQAFLAANRHQRPSEIGHLLGFWIQRDPKSALRTVRPLFDIVAPTRYRDTWDGSLVAPRDLERFAKSRFWPDGRTFSGIGDHIMRSTLPDAEKLNLLDEIAALYDSSINPLDDLLLGSPELLLSSVKGPPSHVTADFLLANHLDDYQLAVEIGAARGSALTPLLDEAVKEGHVAALIVGLRQMIADDASSGPDAIETVVRFAAEGQRRVQEFYQEDSLFHMWLPDAVEEQAEMALEEAVHKWTASDPNSAWSWILENRADDLLGAAGRGMIAHLDPAERAELFDLALRQGEDAPHEISSLAAAWALQEPRLALESALELGGEIAFSQAAEEAFADGTPEQTQAIAEVLESMSVLPDEGNTAMILEGWGDSDVGRAARYGVRWLLATDEFPREHLLKTWSGQDVPVDSTVDDRTFGCLRCWAVCQPDEMQAWIETQTDPEVRRALQWMLDHPDGKPVQADPGDDSS